MTTTGTEPFQFPVSLEDFMKCTYYEELVDKLLETKVQGTELLEMYKNSDYWRKQILQEYYEAFYLRPTIRDAFPIRFRPMPKKRRDRILQVPVFKRVNTDAAEMDADEPMPQDNEPVTKIKFSTSPSKAKSIKRSAESASKSPQTSIPAKRLKAETTPQQSNNVPDSKAQTIAEKQPEQYQLAKGNALEQQPQADDKKKIMKVDYDELSKNENRCPLSFEQFKKYTNIMKLISITAQLKYGNQKHIPKLIKRAYLHYYFIPQDRLSTPLNRLQVLPTCPENLRDRIFEIPKWDSNETPHVEQESKKILEEVTGDNERHPITREANGLIESKGGCLSAMQRNEARRVGRVRPLQIQKHVELPPVAESHDNKVKVPSDCAEAKISSSSSINDKQATDTSKTARECFATNRKQSVPFRSTSGETLEKPNPSVSHNKAKIRKEDIPPNSNNDLKWPRDGINPCTDPMQPSLVETGSHSNVDKCTQTRNVNELEKSQMRSVTIDREELLKYLQIVPAPKMDKAEQIPQKENLPMPPEVFSPPAPQNDHLYSKQNIDCTDFKKPRIPETLATSAQDKNTSNENINFADLKKLAHLCPVTLAQFKKYTNITTLMSKGCQEKYGNPQTHLQFLTKRAYWSYYLHPNIRRVYPLSHLQVNPNCSKALKEKILEIPIQSANKNDAVKNVPNDRVLDASDGLNKHKNIASGGCVSSTSNAAEPTTKENIQPLNSPQQKVYAASKLSTRSHKKSKGNHIKILENRLLAPGQQPPIVPQSSETRSLQSEIESVGTDNVQTGSESSKTTTEVVNKKTLEEVLKKISKSKAWYSQYRLSLLAKINVRSTAEVPLSVSYQIFKDSSYYEDFLKNILSDFCGEEVGLLEVLLGDKEVYDKLLYYFCIRYFANDKLRAKYPLLSIKSSTANKQEKQTIVATNSLPEEAVVIQTTPLSKVVDSVAAVEETPNCKDNFLKDQVEHFNRKRSPIKLKDTRLQTPCVAIALTSPQKEQSNNAVPSLPREQIRSLQLNKDHSPVKSINRILNESSEKSVQIAQSFKEHTPNLLTSPQRQQSSSVKPPARNESESSSSLSPLYKNIAIRVSDDVPTPMEQEGSLQPSETQSAIKIKTSQLQKTTVKSVTTAETLQEKSTKSFQSPKKAISVSLLPNKPSSSPKNQVKRASMIVPSPMEKLPPSLPNKDKSPLKLKANHSKEPSENSGKTAQAIKEQLSNTVTSQRNQKATKLLQPPLLLINTSQRPVNKSQQSKNILPSSSENNKAKTSNNAPLPLELLPTFNQSPAKTKQSCTSIQTDQEKSPRSLRSSEKQHSSSALSPAKRPLSPSKNNSERPSSNAPLSKEQLPSDHSAVHNNAPLSTTKSCTSEQLLKAHSPRPFRSSQEQQSRNLLTTANKPESPSENALTLKAKNKSTTEFSSVPSPRKQLRFSQTSNEKSTTINLKGQQPEETTTADRQVLTKETESSPLPPSSKSKAAVASNNAPLPSVQLILPKSSKDYPALQINIPQITTIPPSTSEQHLKEHSVSSFKSPQTQQSSNLFPASNKPLSSNESPSKNALPLIADNKATTEPNSVPSPKRQLKSLQTSKDHSATTNLKGQQLQNTTAKPCANEQFLKEQAPRSLRRPQKRQSNDLLPPANIALTRSESTRPVNISEKANKLLPPSVQNSSIKPANCVPLSTLSENQNQLHKTATCSKDKDKSQTKRKSGQPNSRRCVVTTELDRRLEQAKEVYFQFYSVKYTIPYMLRISCGLKQRIIEVVADLTLEEFKIVTHIYKGDELYNCEEILNQMYKYVFKTSRIWPRNLYFKLSDICLLMKMNNIAVPEATTALMYISPRFLHWSNLMDNTSFVECVSSNYNRCTGEQLDMEDRRKVENECSGYYNQCWLMDRWIGKVPKLKAALTKMVIVEGITKRLNDPELLEVSLEQESCDTVNNSSKKQAVPPEEDSPQEADTLQTMPTMTESEENRPDATVLEEFGLEVSKTEETMYISNTIEDCEMEITPGLADCNMMAATAEELMEVTPDLANCHIAESAEDVMEVSPDLTNYAEPEAEEEAMEAEGEEAPVIESEEAVMEEPPVLANDSASEANENVMQKTYAVAKNAEKREDLDAMPVPTHLIEVASYMVVPYTEVVVPYTEDLIDVQSQQRETSGSADPLQQYMSVAGLRNTSIQSDSSDDSVIFIPNESIKPEPMSDQLLRNLKFVLADDDSIQCSHLSDEVVDLDTSSQMNATMDAENLPPSQIDFDDNPEPAKQYSPAGAPSKGSSDLMSSGNSSILNLGQRLPSSLDSNETRYDSQPMATDPVQILQLLDVNLASQSSLHCTPEYIPQPLPNLEFFQLEHHLPLCANPSFGNLQEAQRFPSTWDETLATALSNDSEKNEPVEAEGNKNSKSQTTTTNKREKAKPQKAKTTRADLIPQKVHTLRALPVMAVGPKPTSPSKVCQYENEVTPTVALAEPTSVTNIEVSQLIASQQTFVQISPDFMPVPTSTQSLEQQPQLMPHPVATVNSQESLRVSQELLKDNTLFNNSSLIRAVERNYTKSPAENSPAAETLNVVRPLQVNSITTAARACNALTPPKKRRLILYRNLLEMHYFQSLSSEHVSKYQLPTVDYCKPYLQVTVSCGNFKTKISSDPISSLFAQWPLNLRGDVMTVLNDLKEFHFFRFQRSPGEDLRQNILHQFLLTTSPFCKAQLSYEEHNTEFSNCESLWNSCNCVSHLRKPFQSLTHAIKPDILSRLKTLKKDLRNCR